MHRNVFVALSSVVALCHAADEFKLPLETARLKPGPGVELATVNCLLCHSADYISTQPPLSEAAWRATVDKMRTKYGAPIITNNVDAVVKYLSTAYGPKHATGE